MSVFILILLFFAGGYIAQHLLQIPQKLPLYLNWAVIHIAFPAAILLNIPALRFDASALFPVLSFWLCVPIAWYISKWLARHFAWSKETQTAVFVLTALGNTSYLGLPMIQAFFGSPAIPYALIYDQLGSFIGVSVVATIAVAIASKDQQAPSPAQLLKKVVLFPPFVALAIGILPPFQTAIQGLSTPLHWLSQLIVPLTMTAIGLQFRLKIDRQSLAPLSAILGLKMFVYPALIALIGITIDVTPIPLTVTVFETALPPMVTAAALLLAAGIAESLVVSAVGLGTLISFVTLPILAYLLNTFA